jgi:hypothetical protein
VARRHRERRRRRRPDSWLGPLELRHPVLPRLDVAGPVGQPGAAGDSVAGRAAAPAMPADKRVEVDAQLLRRSRRRHQALVGWSGGVVRHENHSVVSSINDVDQQPRSPARTPQPANVPDAGAKSPVPAGYVGPRAVRQVRPILRPVVVRSTAPSRRVSPVRPWTMTYLTHASGRSNQRSASKSAETAACAVSSGTPVVLTSAVASSR